MNNSCICGNNIPYEKCCARFIEENELPSSAVELMRSRYSAYVKKNGQYIYETSSKNLKNFEDIKEINNSNIQWLKLKIHSFSDMEVVFSAYYINAGKIEVMKEHSYFVLEDGKFKYDKAQMLEGKIERNESCPCGSGKKYKKCCGKN